MFWRSKQKSFFDYFEEHAAEIEIAAQLLQQLFSNTHTPTEIAKQIKECEHRADKIIHQVISQMNTSGFILPMDREDIFRFIRSLDDVVDNISESAEAYAEIYQLNNATPEALRFVKIIRDAAEQLKSVCQMVRKPSTHAQTILEQCKKLHQLENEGDVARKEALRALYAKLKQQEIPITEYTAWNELYRNLEVVTDKFEDCADVAEQMVLKYS